jgi:hypothetical protein
VSVFSCPSKRIMKKKFSWLKSTFEPISPMGIENGSVNYKLVPLVLINELSIPFHFKNYLFTHFHLFSFLFIFFLKIDIIKQYIMSVCFYITMCFFKVFFQIIFHLKKHKIDLNNFNVMIL